MGLKTHQKRVLGKRHGERSVPKSRNDTCGTPSEARNVRSPSRRRTPGTWTRPWTVSHPVEHSMERPGFSSRGLDVQGPTSRFREPLDTTTHLVMAQGALEYDQTS